MSEAFWKQISCRGWILYDPVEIYGYNNNEKIIIIPKTLTDFQSMLFPLSFWFAVDLIPLK